ncbi:MAG: branched-chain amino acid aminotransferase [Ignavibacteriaceae bacterium]|nr:branched-chain amino acid aminotransferase [Ignavibacteriaceae bacterium]
MMEKIKYIIKERTGAIVVPENPGFGLLFSDHVFEMDYSPALGWHNPTIKPLQNLSFHPATMVLHYAQAVFEGLKAFKTEDNEVVIFRPQKHLERLNRSARRVCIPELDLDFVMEALKELVSIDHDWIPKKEGEALYIRPFLFGVDGALGVRPSGNYKFIILLSPVGAYYPEGFKPVKILATDEYVRAVRKGLGECKTPANYAASLLAAESARKQGFTQVLWLDGIEQKYIEEVGTMNIFIHFKDEVATPKLTGGILPGVTRDSVINILKDRGENITERLISIDEVVDAYKTGRLVGVFGTGTAAVISSVGTLVYKDTKMIFNEGKVGELDKQLLDTLSSIHYGRAEDKFNWLTHVSPKGVEV